MAFQPNASLLSKWKFLIISFTFLILVGISDAGNTKIAYKKPIYGKINAVNEKYLKLKQENERKIALAQQQQQQQETTSTKNPIVTSNDESTTTTTQKTTNATTTTTTPSRTLVTANIHEIVHIDENYNNTKTTIATTALPKFTTTTTSTTSTIILPSSTSSNLPAYCTCGIFLTSQIQRGQAHGEPVITYELDRVYPCNIIGQRQCQTKCLEKIVQHLPNAANILCATLDRDCRKERAYLFIKNCSHTWWNTSLAAGREYCCKNGQPYQCPLI